MATNNENYISSFEAIRLIVRCLLNTSENRNTSPQDKNVILSSGLYVLKKGY